MNLKSHMIKVFTYFYKLAHQNWKIKATLEKQGPKIVDLTCTLGVSPNFVITEACGLKFHWYLRTLSLKFQKARTKIEELRQPTGPRQENFNFSPSLLKFQTSGFKLGTSKTVDFTPL
jgi:hypothetical protein